MSSEASLQMLTRKGWAVLDKVEKTINLTAEGKALFGQLQEQANKDQTDDLMPDNTQNKDKAKEAIKRVRKAKSDAFERFCKAYPVSTSFVTEDGVKFDGGSPRRNSAKSEKVFHERLTEIEQEGKTVEDLIQAIEFEVNSRKKESVRKGENCMTYLQLMSTWLNQKTYENIWEMMEEEKKIVNIKRKEPIDVSNLF